MYNEEYLFQVEQAIKKLQSGERVVSILLILSVKIAHCTKDEPVSSSLIATGSIYLNAEFTVTEGQYAKRKIFQVIGIKSGKASVEGEDTWGESGRSMLRSILESARNIHANDTSEKAVIARKINSIADFNNKLH